MNWLERKVAGMFLKRILKGKLTYITAAGMILVGLGQAAITISQEGLAMDSLGDSVRMITEGLAVFGLRRAVDG